MTQQRIQKKQKPTNRNWGKAMSLEDKYGAHNISEFDKIVAKLQLTPDQYEHSQSLRNWIERHHKQHYVPEYLLLQLNIRIEVDLD